MTKASTARGVVFIHSCPPALTKHVEWALAGVLGQLVTLEWRTQEHARAQLCAQWVWSGQPGTAASLASQLRHWPLRLEITEEATAAGPGERFALTPTLGLFRGEIGPHGDLQLSEHRLHALIAASADQPWRLVADIESALGVPWDNELEPFRATGEVVGLSQRQVM